MQLQWLRLQSFIVVVVINWVPHKLIFTRKENQTNEEKKKKKKSHTKKIYIFFCLSFWLFLLFYRCFVSFDSITVDVAMYFKLNMEWGFSRCFFFSFLFYSQSTDSIPCRCKYTIDSNKHTIHDYFQRKQARREYTYTFIWIPTEFNCTHFLLEQQLRWTNDNQSTFQLKFVI